MKDTRLENVTLKIQKHELTNRQRKGGTGLDFNRPYHERDCRQAEYQLPHGGNTSEELVAQVGSKEFGTTGPDGLRSAAYCLTKKHV